MSVKLRHNDRGWVPLTGIRRLPRDDLDSTAGALVDLHKEYGWIINPGTSRSPPPTPGIPLDHLMQIARPPIAMTQLTRPRPAAIAG